MIAFVVSFTLQYSKAQVSTSWSFNYRFGELSPNIGLCIVSDGIGNVYNTGTSAGAPGRNDMILSKMNSSNGTVHWMSRFADTLTPYPNNSNGGGSLLLDSIGRVFVGGSRLWQYDLSGNLNWSLLPADRKGFPRIFFDIKKNVLDSKEYNNSSFLIRKYSSEGDSIWEQQFQPTGTIWAYWKDAAIDKQGSIITTGYMNKIGFGAVYDCMTVKYSNEGELLWYDRIDEGTETFGYAVASDNEDNIYVAGEKDLNILTVKYSSDGEILWQREFNGGSGDIGFDIQVDSIGNSYVSGVAGGLGIVLMKYDPTGNLLWLRNHTNVPFSVLGSIVRLDNQGDPYLAFSINSSGGRHEYAVAKYSSEGDSVWLARYNYDNQYCEVFDFTVDRNFDVYVTGRCGNYLSTIKLVQHMTNSASNIKPVIQQFELIGNYPNPFNPVTQIVFKLEKASSVKLEVHDAGGRKIATLLNNRVSSGQHKIAFDTHSHRGLSSGVYFYTLTVGNYSKSLRMLLLK